MSIIYKTPNEIKKDKYQGSKDNSKREPTKRKVLELFDKLPRGKVLEIGAGDGFLSNTLNDMGFNVIASDINTDLFKPKNIDFLKIDANFTFPFEDNSFDYVVSVETIEHLEYPWNLINESYRVLKKRGRGGGGIDIYYS